MEQKAQPVQKVSTNNLFAVTSEVIYNDSIEPEIPELQGDYAKAVFLNAYSKASAIKGKGEYQGYMLYECGIRDCPSYHRGLVDEGYLAESTLEDLIRGLKVAELKPLLEELGLPVSGKKDALVQRIMENADEGFIRQHCPAQTYAISEKGRQFLAEHDIYVRLHQNRRWGVSWREFDENKKPGYSDNDILWGIFNRRVATSISYGRNEYLCMYQILVEERKRRSAIEMLLRIIYIDVSGVEGLDYLRLYRDGSFTEKEAKDNFGASVMIAPGLVADISSYADVYEDAIVDRIYEWKLPLNICEKELFLDMVHSCLNEAFDEKKFMSKLKRAYDEAVHDMRA